MGKKVIVPTALQFEIARIMKSVGQNDTANNAINAIKALGTFGRVHGQSVPDRYRRFHIRTDVTDGMKMFERVCGICAGWRLRHLQTSNTRVTRGIRSVGPTGAACTEVPARNPHSRLTGKASEQSGAFSCTRHRIAL